MPLDIFTSPVIDFKIVLLPDKPLPIIQTGFFAVTLNEIFGDNKKGGGVLSLQVLTNFGELHWM